MVGAQGGQGRVSGCEKQKPATTLMVGEMDVHTGTEGGKQVAIAERFNYLTPCEVGPGQPDQYKPNTRGQLEGCQLGRYGQGGPTFPQK